MTKGYEVYSLSVWFWLVYLITVLGMVAKPLSFYPGSVTYQSFAGKPVRGIVFADQISWVLCTVFCSKQISSPRRRRLQVPFLANQISALPWRTVSLWLSVHFPAPGVGGEILPKAAKSSAPRMTSGSLCRGRCPMGGERGCARRKQTQPASLAGGGALRVNVGSRRGSKRLQGKRSPKTGACICQQQFIADWKVLKGSQWDFVVAEKKDRK